MIMARRQRDPAREQLWRQRLARWHASGQSVRAFCAAEGIPESAWYFWTRELKRRSTAVVKPRATTAAFVPLTVLPAVAGAVEVRCPTGHVVMLPSADAATLA